MGPATHWFAIGAHASAEVGRKERMLESVRDLLDFSGDWMSIPVKVSEALSQIGAQVGYQQMSWITAKRALTLCQHAPGGTASEKVRAIAQTGLNMLEHGNRLIFKHICGAFAEYLAWRHRQGSRSICAQQVLSSLGPTLFNVPGVVPSNRSTDPHKVQKLYDAIQMDLTHMNEDQAALLSEYPCVDILPVAFACWEEAARLFRADTPELGHHHRWMQAGNNLIVFCEQAEAVAPAFRPAGLGQVFSSTSEDEVRPLPGEVSREYFMLTLTPLVQLPFRRGGWSLSAYTQDSVSLNWGRFRDRYVPILEGAFALAYASHPTDIWPGPKL